MPLLHFVETTPFTKKIDGTGGMELLYAIQNELLENPARGDTVAGTGGTRKARIADPARGKGKRGGFRYIYYYFKEVQVIYLLILYGKDEQDDLTAEQKRIIKGFVEKAQKNIKELYG